MGQRIERVSDLREFSQKLTGYLGTPLVFAKSFIIDFERVKNKLERLEQLEEIRNNAMSYLEYYLIGRLDLEDSQEEFNKLLKMLKGEK